MAAIVSPNYAFCLQHFILGWSDFHFLQFFENENIAIDWLYFYVFNFKNTANFAACARGARAAKFSFSKNHRDLENEYIFFKLA